MGAFSSTEACELPDLSINVDLHEDAKTPTFETPGRGGLTLSGQRVCAAARSAASQASSSARRPDTRGASSTSSRATII